MRNSLKSAIGGAAALSLAAGMMVLGSASAEAAAPAFETNTHTLGFYNAAGTQIFSGNINDPVMATYYVADSPITDSSPVHKSNMRYATPQDGVPEELWSTEEQWTSSQTVGASSEPDVGPVPLPANLAAKAALGQPVVMDDSGLPIGDHVTAAPNLSTVSPNIYQVRIVGNPGGEVWVADVQVDPATGNWTQVYPTVKTATTLSAITPSVPSPAPHGSSVTLTSTLTAAGGAHPAGTVQLLDGATAVAGAALVAATGAVSATVTPADGPHNYSFVFTPTDTATYTGATSATLAYNVNAPEPAANTKTVLTGPSTATQGTPVSIVAAVTTIATSGSTIPAGTAVTAGNVQFKIDGTNAALVPLGATGTANFPYSPTDTNPHTITGTFIPANPANFATSSDTTGVTVTASAPAYAPDPQNVIVTVPAGTLVISTPYTAAHPFDLGTLQLSADGTSFSTVPVNFGDPAAAAGTDPGAFSATNTPSTSNGVTITDTRAGSTGWKASIVTTDFADGAAHSIPGDNLKFNNITAKFLPGNTLNSTNVTTPSTPLIGFHTTAQQFAQATAGPGTVNVTGNLSLTAPSSTIAGTYTATVTFSII